MSNTPEFEEVVILQPTKSELKNRPLIVDTQWLEPLASDSLNRKFFGIVRKGIFKGFFCEPIGGLEIKIHHSKNQDGSPTDFGIALVEDKDYLLTVRLQKDIILTVPTGRKYYIVLDANYQVGVVTRQVSIDSDVEPATIKVISESSLKAHHVVICSLDLPPESTEIEHIDIDHSDAEAGGYDISAHLNESDPHQQYQQKSHAATIEEIDDKQPSLLKHITLSTLWRALHNFFSGRRINTEGPLNGAGNLSKDINLTIDRATTSRVGVTQLTDVDGTSSELAASQKLVHDLTKDSDKLDGIDSRGFGRAYSASHSTGGGNWTTAQFVSWLKSKGCFNHAYWMIKASWSYADNRLISDTGCGKIHLAGCVIEVMGHEGAYTIRVTTPTTSSGGGTTNAVFIYTNHGPGYSPSWRRDYNTRLKPTATDVGALTQTQADGRYLAKNAKANSAVISDKVALWNSSSNNFYPIVFTSVNMLYGTQNGAGVYYRPKDGFTKIKHGQIAGLNLTHDESGKIKLANDNKRSAGMYGLYNSHKIGHIWSVGSGYKIDDRGANFGNLHGLAYKHTNNRTGGTMAGGHQAVWCEDGTPKSAMGSDGLWGKQVFDGEGNNRQRVYSPNNPPPAPPPPPTTGIWQKVASGSLNHRLLSHDSVKRETVVTDVHVTTNRFGMDRYQVVITTSARGLTADNNKIDLVWWKAWAVLKPHVSKWRNQEFVTFDVYTSGANINNGPTWGHVTGWELWKLNI